jgi:hypothetical protein
MTRWPGTESNAILWTRAIWSMPALERESEARTRPLRSRIPRQYVTVSLR